MGLDHYAVRYDQASHNNAIKLINRPDFHKQDFEQPSW